MSSEVRFEGDEAAMADLRRWADQLAPAVAKASGPFGDRIAGLVAGRVPVLTGALADSVTSSSSEDGLELELGAGLDYAGWIEFGGSHGRPHIAEGRYLYPTALEAQDEWADAAGEAAEDSVGRFSWSTAH